MEFTVDQKKIIDARNCNLLVSAAAGSGKTAVLVERIIRLITDATNPVDIDSLLVVTFTRAAAAQMREKISDAISKELINQPDNVLLQRQAALVHNAQITTIDSFCQYILRNSFADIDLDPGFRLADEGEMSLLMRDTLDAVLEELYASGDESFAYMSDSIAYGTEDDKIDELVLKLYDTAMSDPWPRQWLNRHADDYAPRLEGSWYDRIGMMTATKISQAKAYLNKAHKLALDPAGPYMYGEQIEAEIEMLDKTIEWIDANNDYDELSAHVSNIVFDRLTSCRDKAVNTDIKDHVTDLRKKAKEIVTYLNNNYFTRSAESHLAQMKRCDSVLKELIRVTLLFMDRLDENKRDKGILSFADCEHLALDVLIKVDEDGNMTLSDTAKEYRSHFSYVFIDEYQDSNMIQELLLSAVSGESEGIFNRFMVGDLKQSIYRFRQADPTIFIQKYNEYDVDSDTHQVIDLHQNFRSRSQVLEATNFVFEKLMSEAMGGVDYDDKAALYLGASYTSPEDDAYKAEFIIYDSAEEAELTAKELEAKGVASKIEELMSTTKVVENKPEDGLRPVRYGDIVILLRAAKSDSDIYKKALEARGIPVHVTGTDGYFASYEIQTLLHLLRVINNPLQDISFYGVMSSVIGGFTPEEIATIRIYYIQGLAADDRVGEGYLYKACINMTSVTDNNILRDKTLVFIDMLNRYRDMAEYMSVEELLSQILRDTNYRAIVSAMRGGDKRLANVDMLIRKASDYAHTSYFGLHNFMRYIDTIQKYEMDSAEAETIDEKADVVRIMSIHKSKGLEFPVCFVSGLGKKFNKSDAQSFMIIDNDLGLGIKDVDIDRRIQSGTLRRVAVADKIVKDSIAEELRVLYVAMTRAKEKLILTASVDNLESTLSSIDDLLDGKTISPNAVADAAGFSEWLYMCMSDPDFEKYFRVSTLTKSDIEADELIQDIDYELLNKELDSLSAGDKDIDELGDLRQYITRLFTDKYPHEHLSGLYTKTSVSELKHAAMPDDAEAAFDLLNLGAVKDDDEKNEVDIIPRFITGTSDKPGATVRGSAFHRAVELIDFAKLYDEIKVGSNDDSKLIIDKLDMFTASGAMSHEARRIFDNKSELKLLTQFMVNPIMERIVQADRNGELYKEAPFMMGISASKLDKKYPDEETVLIQGIIDAYWREDDGYVILDYKTDRVGSVDRLVELYQAQLDYYEQALRSMGLPVKEKIIYSFACDEAIRLAPKEMGD